MNLPGTELYPCVDNVVVHDDRYLLVLDDKVPRLDLVVHVARNTPLTVRFDRSKELL